MSLIDKAKKFINDNPDKVRQGIDKIGDAIDKRTDGKYADKVDRVQQEAAKRLGGDATPNTEPDTPAPTRRRPTRTPDHGRAGRRKASYPQVTPVACTGQ